MRNFFCFLLFIVLPNFLVAQTGKITGKVISASSGQVLPSATVTLVEKSKMIAADQNGIFTFSKLEPGTYSIKCSYGGYKEKIIEEIVVKNNDNTAVTISLEEKAVGEVVITTKVNLRRETVASLLVAQKNSASVSDGISSEAIRKTPDRNTSDVLKRISGASIQDDRFAVIRGLNDRYNAAFINGAPLPSSESDRKAFAFDIFPSSILDNLIIYKTATPDKTGEFAGGIIDITTKSIPSKNFTSISIGGSYNSVLTGKDRKYSDTRGGKDWLGIDDGSRAIPDGVPSSPTELRALTAVQKAELAKLYGNYKWGISRKTTSPNFNFQISQGLNIERKGKDFFGALFSVTYNKTFTFKEGERNSFAFTPTETPLPGEIPIQVNKYKDSTYNDEVVLAALANFSFKLDNRNSISWRNNLSINSDNQVISRIGAYDDQNEPDNFVKDDVRWFTSNQIFSSQLLGEHQVGSFKAKINWLASYSKVERKIPNLARTSYSVNRNFPDDIYAFFSTPPSQTVGSGTMFSTRSNESIKNIKVDITQPYKFLGNTQNLVKVGAGFQKRERDFTSRTLGLTPYNEGVNFDYSLFLLTPDKIFLPENLGKKDDGKGGFTLADGTLSNSNYDASSSLAHAYFMSDQRFLKKFRVIVGVRLESFNQKLNFIDGQTNKPARVDSTVTDWLPSVNLVYALTPKMNIRLSFAETVNRPEFRELAPFLFFEYVSGFSYNGYRYLRRSKIKNYDFRYEFYPGKAQVFSVSAFYKDFANPIEIIQIPETSSQTIFVNTTSAKVYGMELEFRTLISTLLGVKRESSILNKFTLSANAAITRSEIKLLKLYDFNPEQLVTNRALQGQSPYLINTSLGYNDEKLGLSSTLSVNRVGDRVYLPGTYNLANIYERARTIVDLQIAKTFLKEKLEVKFNARDILAQKINYYLDYDKSKSYTEIDRLFSSSIAPKIFSLSATYKF
ncbi:MAG: TonB-dependent receptor [Chitinophagaceae bacterium]|nr:TonB-dependent receptor [Chitinophagaceae bacterium]